MLKSGSKPKPSVSIIPSLKNVKGDSFTAAAGTIDTGSQCGAKTGAKPGCCRARLRVVRLRLHAERGKEVPRDVVVVDDADEPPRVVDGLQQLAAGAALLVERPTRSAVPTRMHLTSHQVSWMVCSSFRLGLSSSYSDPHSLSHRPKASSFHTWKLTGSTTVGCSTSVPAGRARQGGGDAEGLAQGRGPQCLQLEAGQRSGM